MRIANLAGRLTLLRADRGLDVATASDGRFEPDPQAVFGRWEEFELWAAEAPVDDATPFDPLLLGAPAPRPAQVFTIGLNYSEHAHEAGFVVPDVAPPVLTKFPSCITGPYGDVRLPPGGNTDWEVELVVVIGRGAVDVALGDAWTHVAGLAVGQDLSERRSQMVGRAPQFSLAKSFLRFGPVGPWLTTVDELDDPDDLAVSPAVNGETVQDARTSQLLLDVPHVLVQLSSVVPLLPGDVVFTGTPAGVGMGRTPQRWLAAGDELVSKIEGLRELRHRFIA